LIDIFPVVILIRALQTSAFIVQTQNTVIASQKYIIECKARQKAPAKWQGSARKKWHSIGQHDRQWSQQSDLKALSSRDQTKVVCDYSAPGGSLY